jgi:hypothetical protein
MTETPLSSSEASENESGRLIKFYFGRFNLIAIYENKKDFILNGLNTAEMISRRNYTWGFFEISLIEDEMGEFISGYLVKYNPEGEGGEFADPIMRQLGETTFPNSVAAKSRFFIHIKTGVIAYYLNPGISISQFKELFTVIFQKAYDNFFVNAEIQDIAIKYNFFERIRNFQKILKVQIYLHPSNPSNHDRWKQTDDRLKRLGASSYREIYEAKPNSTGLNLQQDEDFNSKAHMAEDGYGKAKVKGVIGEGKFDVSTGEEPITSLAPVEGLGQRILSVLMPTFKDIFRRTPNENKT